MTHDYPPPVLCSRSRMGIAVLAFLSLFSITAGFSLVTPHFGGADEPEHFYYMMR